MKNKLFLLDNKINEKIDKEWKKSEYFLKIDDFIPKISQSLEDKVEKNWIQFAKQYPQIASNQLTFYYSKFDKNLNSDYIFSEKFKYVQAFGKTKAFQKYSCEASANNLVALSSLCLILTVDKKLIFGIKKNMHNKISGFSGYLKEKYIKDKHVDIYNYLANSIKDELNIIPDHIQEITRIGQGFSNEILDLQGNINNRVYNNNFLVSLRITSNKVIKNFEKNFQFDELKIVSLEKRSISEFLYKNEKTTSIHCIGAVFNLMALYFKEHKEEEILERFKFIEIDKSYLKKGKEKVVDWIKNLDLFKIGLVGNSQISSYSVAPYMWNNLFKTLNYPINYFVLNSDDEEEVRNKLNEMICNKNFIGCNIAMPWKSLGFSLCNEVDENISKFKTINTLVNNNGVIKGFNTDGSGMTEVLKNNMLLTNKKILIMGAGGACQTLPKHLLENKVNKLYICDIKNKNSERLEKLYNPEKNGKVTAVSHSELKDIISEIDILINATPCGMKNHIEKLPFEKNLLKSLKNDIKIAEMVYNPLYTPLLESAKEKNEVYSGVNMLVEQAAISFEHGFGRSLTLEEKKIMKEAAKAALKLI